MPKRIKVEEPATPEEGETAYKASTDRYERGRLLALKMAQQGEWTVAQIAKAIGRGCSTIFRWISAYRQRGIEQILLVYHHLLIVYNPNF